MQSQASTVADYLKELPADRRQAIETVRQVILENLDPVYAESMGYGMIGYFVPLSVYPVGYHANPQMGLSFAGLASQKNYMSLYLLGVYCGCAPGEVSKHLSASNHRQFEEAWAKTGKKLDMGKACIRFKRVEDLALDVIGDAIRRLPAAKYIEFYEEALRSRAGRPRGKPGKKPPARKAAVKKTAAKKSAKSAAKSGVAKKKAAKKKAARKSARAKGR